MNIDPGIIPEPETEISAEGVRMSGIRVGGWKTLAVLLIVAATMIVLYGQIDYEAEPYSNCDLAKYREMASASPRLATDIKSPFAFRVLGPYIVGLLPGPDPVGFYALAVVLSIGLVLLFYSFLCHMGLSTSAAAVAVVLFTFNKYWFGFTVWDYFQVNDLLSLVCIVVLFRSMLEDRWVIFGVTLLVGAVTREASLLMVPVAIAYLLEAKKFSDKWKAALLAMVPGLVAFLLLRALIPTTGGSTLVEAFSRYAGKAVSPQRLFGLLANSFLPFSFFPLVFPEATLRFFRTRKYAVLFLVLVFLSTLFGRNDERLMAPAFVVVYALIGTVIWELNPGKGFLAVLIGAGVVSSLHHVMARYPLADVTLTRVLSLGSLLLVTMAAIALRAKRRWQHREDSPET